MMTLFKLIRPLRPAAFALGLCCISAIAEAPGDIRVAIVIGNAAYSAVPALANPVNDAKAMGDTLRGLGFNVIELRDGSKAQMAQAIARARDLLKGKRGVGMLYYAGHGLQIDARNYMVPVDAKIGKADDVQHQTVDVNGVVEAFKGAGNRMNILVLDACRDNPFGKITSGKGLAPLDAPSGTFLAYATAPGNVAEDGDVKSGNGLYTQYLLQELKKPQTRIEDVFKRVRFAVRQASNGRQIPWESTSLEDDFTFNDGKLVALVKPTAQQLTTEFNQEKQDWERIKNSTNLDDFYAFLQKYPNGTIAAAAQGRLDLLASPALVVQGAGADGRSQAYVVPKYRAGDIYETRMSSSLTPGKYMTDEKRVTAGANGEILVESSVRGPGGKPIINIFDAQGAFKGVQGVFRTEPPQYVMPTGLLQVGASWKQSNQTTMEMPGAPSIPPANTLAKITAREKITVPAGTFDTFRMEQETVLPPGSPTPSTTCTLWVAPDIALPVKMQCSQQMGGKPYDFGEELVRFTRGS